MDCASSDVVTEISSSTRAATSGISNTWRKETFETVQQVRSFQTIFIGTCVQHRIYFRKSLCPVGVSAAGAGVAVVVVDKVEEGLQLDMEMQEADSFFVERKITE